MLKEKLRTLGRRITTRRALVFLCAGAIASALSGMICGATQSGLLNYYDYEVAKWKGNSSKFDWPGQMPQRWVKLMKTVPDRIDHIRSVAVGWMHLRLDKVWNAPHLDVFSYSVYAWGFPIPSMRHDTAFVYPITAGWPDSNNTVDDKLLRGFDFTSYKFGPNSLPFGMIPLIPWWPGFILNTLLWSLALAWTAKTLQRARWFKRMQRGQCIKCKYQVGSLRTCPECGTEKPCP